VLVSKIARFARGTSCDADYGDYLLERGSTKILALGWQPGAVRRSSGFSRTSVYTSNAFSFQMMPSVPIPCGDLGRSMWTV